MSVNPIPQGYTSLTPFLVIDGAAGAIDFYTSVFGALLIEKMDGSDGSVAHAELDFGSGRLQLSDPNADYKLGSARAQGVGHSFDRAVLLRRRRRCRAHREGRSRHP